MVVGLVFEVVGGGGGGDASARSRGGASARAVRGARMRC